MFAVTVDSQVCQKERRMNNKKKKNINSNILHGGGFSF